LPWGFEGICGLRRPLIWVFFCIVLLGIGCATRRPPERVPGAQKPYKIYDQWYQPIADAKGFRQKGIASWYGLDFHGKKTANGEVYNMYDITAAHTILPLGTWVRVHNLDNDKQLDVRINDRGPFVRGRIIDLSYKSATTLGVVGPGTAPVEIVALGKFSGEPSTPPEKRQYTPVDYDQGVFTVQVGAFQDPRNADRLKQRLALSYPNAHIVTYDSGTAIYYRVRVGRYTSLSAGEAFEKSLTQNGFPDAMVVAE
jgi:rare lipoprotein A